MNNNVKKPGCLTLILMILVAIWLFDGCDKKETVDPCLIDVYQIVGNSTDTVKELLGDPVIINTNDKYVEMDYEFNDWFWTVTYVDNKAIKISINDINNIMFTDYRNLMCKLNIEPKNPSKSSLMLNEWNNIDDIEKITITRDENGMIVLVNIIF